MRSALCLSLLFDQSFVTYPLISQFCSTLNLVQWMFARVCHVATWYSLIDYMKLAVCILSESARQW